MGSTCLLEYCISGTGTNYDGGYFSAGTYDGYDYFTGDTYTIYYSTGQTQWCLASTLGDPTCLLFGKSPCSSLCPDLCDELFGPGPCPSPTPTPTAACSIDFEAVFDCEVTVTPTVTPTSTPTMTPTMTPSSSNPCGGVSIVVSGVTYTPTPTPTPTVTPTQSADILRPCNYTGLVIFNTVDDYIRCSNSKQFRDCTSGFIYSTTNIVLNPTGGVPIIDYVYGATINGNDICVTYLGVVDNISGSDVVTLNIDYGIDCSSCLPIPSPTPTTTPTPTPTVTPSSTPSVCCEYDVTNLLFTANTFTTTNCSNGVPQTNNINGNSTITIKSWTVPNGANINVVFVDCPCVTPTPTPSMSATPTQTPTPTSTSTSMSTLDYNFTANCGYDPDTITLNVNVITGGVPPYELATAFFVSESAALANTSWSVGSGYGLGVVPVNSTWWFVVKDSIGTILAKSVTSTC